jgi:hypothetical protein
MKLPKPFSLYDAAIYAVFIVGGIGNNTGS